MRNWGNWKVNSNTLCSKFDWLGKDTYLIEIRILKILIW
jgi:hypothetical protein